jgi:ribosomal protein S18 acetylase RimI-like enzyme
VEISIIKGTRKHLNDCIEALVDSEIGSVYFSSKQGAKAFLREGLAKEEIFVALDEQGDCLGYVWFTLTGAFYRFPYVLNLAIKRNLRGKGIGKRLLSFFEDRGFKKASTLFLLVSDFNDKAKKFYQDLGYQEVGLIPDLVREGVTEHIMMKSKKLSG